MHKDVTITAEELHIALNPLQALARKDFKVKTAYNFSRTMTNVEGEVKSIQKFRQELQDKHQKKDKKGNPVWKTELDPKTGKTKEIEPKQPEFEDEKAYNDAVEELSKQEVTFKAYCVKLSTLGDKIKPSELMAIDWMIIDDIDDDAEEVPAEPEPEAAAA